MAKKTPPKGLSEYMAEIGRKGGRATGKAKGFAAMDDATRKKIVAKGLETRRANAAKRTNKAGKKAGEVKK